MPLRLATLLFVGLLVVARLPSSSAQTTMPNIVVLVTDDQDVDSLPVMRNLVSYPEGSWVRFTNAFVNDSICCPARASLLTGQYARTHGVIKNDAGDRLDDANTLPVWLDRVGYQTGLIGKYLNGFPWNRGRSYVPPGWDVFKWTGIGRADGRTNLAVNFINAATSPFFLYLAYSEPHAPTQPPARYANADVYVPPDRLNYDEGDVSDKPRWVRNLQPLSQATIDQWRLERVASQRSLLAVDDSIQRIVDALKAKGQLDRTMIVYLGDHGFSWGSHRWFKKFCVYEECIRTPLLIRFPGVGASRDETRLVSNVDIATTIADYAGITPGLPQDGRSFLSLLTGAPSAWSEEIFLEVHDAVIRTFDGIRVPGWLYAEYANGDRELYDMTNDPFQLQNLASNPAYQAKQDELAQQMRALRDS